MKKFAISLVLLLTVNLVFAQETEKTDFEKRAVKIAAILEKLEELGKNKGKIEEARSSLDELKSHILEEPRFRGIVLVPRFEQPVKRIGENNGNPEFFDSILAEFQTVFRESEHPDLQRIAKMIDGRKRFLSLPGNEMKIESMLLDGKTFDWEPFKGKVVLIDFWATWCGPCLREVPNMRANWDKYHDQGFEIIGIAVQDKTEAVKLHIAKGETPWTILDDQQWIDAKNESIADYYGIAGIPCMILIGRDGKVISLEARGNKLNKELEKLFEK